MVAGFWCHSRVIRSSMEEETMGHIEELERKLHELRMNRAGVESEIGQVNAQLDLAKQEIARDSAGKDLIEAAKTYSEVRTRFDQLVRDRINSFDPLEDGDLKKEFWPWLEKLGKKVAYWHGGNFDPVKRAVDNVIWDILNEDNWSMESWEQCGRLVATYSDLVNKLYKHCFEMKGVEKGDDAYSDWTDCLPLAGRKVVDGILSDDLATYKQVGAAIEKARPKLVKLIQNGENYIRMAMDNVLKEYFTNVVRHLDEEED